MNRHQPRSARPTTIRFRATLAQVAGIAVLATVLVASPAAATPPCFTPWGSLPESASVERRDEAFVVDVRAGRHECFDRLVVDVEGEATSVHVSYVDRLVADGRGDVVALAGGAVVEIRVDAPSHDSNGHPLYEPLDPDHAVPVNGWQTFRQVAFVGSFEGQTQIGVGVRARLPFRVFALDSDGSSRLVIDIAHHW